MVLVVAEGRALFAKERMHFPQKTKQTKIQIDLMTQVPDSSTLGIFNEDAALSPSAERCTTDIQAR